MIISKYSKKTTQQRNCNIRLTSTKYTICAWKDNNKTRDFKKMNKFLEFNSNKNLEELVKVIHIAIRIKAIKGSSIRIYTNESNTLVRIIPIL